MVDKEPKEQKQQKRLEHSQGGITSAPMRRSEAMSRRRRVGWLPQRRTASGWSMRRGVMSAGSREAHRLVRILEQAGWSVWRTGSGHWRAEAPDGRELVIASSPGNAGFARDRLKVRRALADGDR